MKLVIDIGNTFTKLGVFKADELVFQDIFEKPVSGILEMCFQKYPEISNAIVSNVAGNNEEFEQYLASKVPVIHLDTQIRLPFEIQYKTPETLGKDRIAGVAGALSHFPESNVLVIDAGSCITCDLLTQEHKYLGGSISPGINMRFKSLHTFTGKLPLIEFERNLDVELLGNTTRNSILSGVQKAVLLEVDATIDTYKKRFHDLQIVISGGDHKYLYKYLKNNIFAAPNLVLIGLKKILDYNEGS